MSLLQLSSQNIPAITAALPCPIYNRSLIKAGIVHIGVGGFHRAHQAYYLHQLLADEKNAHWGICGIGLRETDRKMSNILLRQDCLYTLVTQHPDGRDTTEVIGSIVDYIFAVETPSLAVEKMAHPDTKIVSLTITEGGYNFNPITGEFDFNNQDVQHELQYPNDPKTVFGFLTAALKNRKDKGQPAFTVLSCDNIIHNGDVASKMLSSFVQKQDPELAAWIEKNVCFPNSMVDRITPVTTESSIAFLKNKYKLQDDWPVVCEPYIQWVVEDDFSNGRPPLDKLGVQFVSDVTPYEKMKIRLLNAGHSVLGILGAIHGHASINECMEDNLLASFMRQFMDEEVTPLLEEIEGIDLTEYKNNLETRFANPNIKDGVIRICSESSAKLPKFLIPTIEENLEQGGSIKYGTFVLAAWSYYSHKGVSYDNQAIEIIDERKEELHQFAKQYDQDKLSFLRTPDIFGNLIDSERFKKNYLKMTEKLYEESSMHILIESISDDNFLVE